MYNFNSPSIFFSIIEYAVQRERDLLKLRAEWLEKLATDKGIKKEDIEGLEEEEKDMQLVEEYQEKTEILKRDADDKEHMIW